MGLYKTSIISGANEESFIDDFVSAVLSAGAGHVTGGVVSPGFNPDEGESNTPVIEFTIDSVAKLALTRPAEVKKTNGAVNSSTAINRYDVSITHVPTGQSINTSGFSSVDCFRFRTQATYIGQAVRHWKLAVISNAKVFILQLGTFDQSAVDYNPFAQISVLADGTTKIVRGKIRNGSTYSQDTGYLLTDGTALTMVDRQAFVYDEQNANQYEPSKQAQYAYYASGNGKIKYHHTATSSPVIWCVRSPHYNYSNFFCLVNNYGTVGSASSRYSRGIAPIFLV